MAAICHKTHMTRYGDQAAAKHQQEIITIDVYRDTAEIIEDCLDDPQPFIIDEFLKYKSNRLWTIHAAGSTGSLYSP